jgi:hypothetical protein
MFVRPYIRLSTCTRSAPTELISMEFDIGGFH